MPRGQAGVVSLVQNGNSGQLRVPKEIYDLLKTNKPNVRYTVELTNEGVLFKPFVPTEVLGGDLPDWLKKAV